MNDIDRRGDLVLTQNPNRGLDYIISLEGIVESATALKVRLRYVPDRNILCPDSFSRYLDSLSAMTWESREQIAAHILDDINNEVVARWVQIMLQVTAEPTVPHLVLMEDRQPKWDNPDLLSRLAKI
ncbi:MAG: hypothetical protein O3A84_06205 [Proteobacteria bacterium]|nr:hypothetical protein [Pseudomonadota bacterium]